MTDFLAGFYGGLALGWIVRQLVGRRRSYWLDYQRRRRSNRTSTLLELPPLPRRWEESPVQRGNGHGGPTTPKAQIRPTPQQPLTADLIRYWKWQDEQVRQALEDGTNNQPPGDAP